MEGSTPLSLSCLTLALLRYPLSFSITFHFLESLCAAQVIILIMASWS